MRDAFEDRGQRLFHRIQTDKALKLRMDIDVLARVARKCVEELFHRHFVHDHAVGLRLDRRLRRRHEAAHPRGWRDDGFCGRRTRTRALDDVAFGWRNVRANVLASAHAKCKSHGNESAQSVGMQSEALGLPGPRAREAARRMFLTFLFSPPVPLVLIRPHHSRARIGLTVLAQQVGADGTRSVTYGSFGSRNAAVLESLLRRLWVFTRPT